MIREETSKALEGKIDQPNSSKKFFTTKEACAYMQISKSHIYKLTSKGQIAHSKRGKKIYLEKTVLDQWILGRKVKTVDEMEREN